MPLTWPLGQLVSRLAALGIVAQAGHGLLHQELVGEDVLMTSPETCRSPIQRARSRLGASQMSSCIQRCAVYAPVYQSLVSSGSEQSNAPLYCTG